MVSGLCQVPKPHSVFVILLKEQGRRAASNGAWALAVSNEGAAKEPLDARIARLCNTCAARGYAPERLLRSPDAWAALWLAAARALACSAWDVRRAWGHGMSGGGRLIES